MNYSSVEFMLIFPLFCALYWLVRSQRGKLVTLLIGSFLFYAYGEPGGVPLLVAVIALAYLSGRLMEFPGAPRRLIVAAAIALLLIDLAFFKYSGFASSLLPPGVVFPAAPFLPLGISFFTFEAIAYVVDLRRGATGAERSPLRLALFVAVFPHLISGPIMRPGDILPQLRRRLEWHLPVFVSGLQLFVEGLFKKRILGDTAGAIVDPIFGAVGGAGTEAAWLAALAYTVQIYGDFAGYTDMGRGIARMLGLELPLNFDSPYASASITEFWRRWHISLSSWLRDYLYVPLGGNRRGHLRTYGNLVTTMILGGLWHGAGWTFLLWGAYHGLLLAFERRFRWYQYVPRWLATAVALFLVVNGWVLFRAQQLPVYLAMLHALYIPTRGVPPSTRDVIIIAALFAGTVAAMIVGPMKGVLTKIRRATVLSGLGYGAVIGAVLLFAPTATRPFIYFRF